MGRDVWKSRRSNIVIKAGPVKSPKLRDSKLRRTHTHTEGEREIPAGSDSVYGDFSPLAKTFLPSVRKYSARMWNWSTNEPRKVGFGWTGCRTESTVGLLMGAESTASGL